MRDILPAINKWLEQGEQIAVATVIQTWGSSPRRVGANMAITLTGKTAGSVSGGCVEGAVIQAGMDTLKSGQPQLLHFGVADETAWQVGLACGGTIEVFIRPLDPLAFNSLHSALEKPIQAVSVIVINGPLKLMGKELLFSRERKLYGDFEKNFEQTVSEIASQTFIDRRSGRTVLKSIPGAVEIFSEFIPAPPALVMVGGVHIALGLSSMARIMGYQTVIVDPRRAFGNTERFDSVDRLIQSWPEEAFTQLELTEDTAVIVLSHDPKIDDPALKLAFASPAFYIGALGSRSTQAKRRERLLEAGISEAQLARLHAPVGLKIGAQTPEEIALSILAEVIAQANGQMKSPETNGAAHSPTSTQNEAKA
jgi:xanthine dehydrogenase accessory factor